MWDLNSWLGGKMYEKISTKQSKDDDSQFDERRENLSKLNQALYHFDLSASRLHDSYKRLQQRIDLLNLELEEKNKQLEINLRERERDEEYLSNILESLKNGVVVVDGKGDVKTFNRAAEQITGMSRRDVEGKCFNQVIKPLLLDDCTRIFSVDDSLKSEGEYKLKRKDGRDMRVKFSITPLKEKGKQLEDSVIILQEVTRLRKLEETAERNNRLAAMGEIAVCIAHEVRNPLGSIELLASLLKREVGSDEDKKKLTDHILAGVKSIDCIINNLLLFSKPQHPVFKEVNVHAFLDESLLFILPSLKQKQIELIKKYDSFDPLVLGDLELLKQVSLNLVWNAIQAMSQGGELTLSTKIMDNGLELPHAMGCLEITFADSGVGISELDKGKIFHPFFTTKEKGTGLGLAIVHNIVEVHDGMIEVESRDGEGSTFTITLPLVGKEERRD